MSLTEIPAFARADGPDKVSGLGRYTADLTLTGMAHAAFRYADVPHGRIVELDTSPARAMSGVVAVITDADVPDIYLSAEIADRTLFARDVVRYEGEVVAAVAAVTPEIARAAAAAIVVRYEVLPAVTDIEAALGENSPLVHESWDSYATSGDVVRDRNTAMRSELHRGDADAAMATADVVVSGRYVADASHAVPIEPRAVVAEWQGDHLTVHTSTQVPFDARSRICETLELPTSRVRVIVPHLGGGFGGKCGAHFEPHIAALAKVAKRPVKLVFSRYEEFIAPDRRREGMIVDVATGVKHDGTIVARAAWLGIDNGAYMADATFFPQLAAMHVAGPYRTGSLKIEADLVYTNRQPSGSVRAPTAPQACWAIESHTDEIAVALDMDPIEFRRRNLVATGDVGPMGQVYDEIGALECLELATASAQASADQKPLGPDEALGVSMGWWPTFAVAAGAFAKMHADGTVQLVTGGQECGTGAVMTLRNLAADELGIDPELIELVYQDTAVAPEGPGASGSQTLLNHGRAVEVASQQIAAQLRELAADHLEAAPEDIVLAESKASVAGAPAASVAFTELVERAGAELLGTASVEMPEYPELPTSSTCIGDQGMGAWLAPQFSCHVARVAVDRDTGVVRVSEVHTAHDSGTIINLMGAHGQVEGGVLMGVGQALTEGTRYDDEGRQRNAGLLEYKLQTIADAPSIHTQFVEIATPNAGPRGAKGLAEAPNVATAGAIANALAKVIGQRVRELPMTAERVWRAQTADQSSTTTEQDQS